MGIRDWPASERPREKLIELGAEALSDAGDFSARWSGGKKRG
jgi:hypothetical protein